VKSGDRDKPHRDPSTHSSWSPSTMACPEPQERKHNNLGYLLGELRRIAEQKEIREAHDFLHILQPHDLQMREMPIDISTPRATQAAS
jgi:hypothetical protein